MKTKRVKVVKWRDNGMTAEVLYVGELISRRGRVVKVRVTEDCANRSFKVGEVREEHPSDLLVAEEGE